MVGDKLREIINKRKITMAEIAVAIGVTPMTITNIVKGADPKSSTLKNIADYLNLPIGYFFDEIEFNNPSLLLEPATEYITVKSKGAFIDNISKQIDRLTETVLSQQRTIENLTQKKPYAS